FRLLRIFKLAAFRKRQKVKARPRKLNAKIDRIVDVIATGNYFVSQVACAHDIVTSNRFANGLINLQRQAQAIFSRSAITVVAIVERTEKASHRVGMRVMKFDTVKACLASAPSSLGKNVWQHLRQIAHVRQMHVSDVLAITKSKRLQFTRVKYAINSFGGRLFKKLSHLFLARQQPFLVFSKLRQCLPVPVVDL